MNLNDIRANAYQNASKAESKDEKTSEKPLFSDVNVEIGKILSQNVKKDQKNINQQKTQQSQTGLIKVPAKEKQSDEKDSVYRRVAKFLLLIGVDEAAKIIPHLSAEQTERIIPEIASIRSVDPDEASVILAEFQSLLERARESGGVDTARNILEKAYGSDRAEELLSKVVPFKGAKPFDYLNDADSERIYFLLKDESAAVRALVLSHLEPKKSASVINLMDSEDKKDVIFRLAKMQPISPDILRRIDQAMHEKSLAQTSEKAENIDGRNALAEILKKMSPSAENEILSSLSEEDPDLGQDLRSRLFTIDDVIACDDRFLQEYLRTMSDVDIAFLLAGKPDSFRDKIFSCVSSGRKVQIQDEEQLNKPMLRKDCERITSHFFSVLRRAFEEGKLIIKNRNDDIYV